ncbi:MAG: hypothetical protein E6Q97_11875 [Desulfurellales bacterium]|nr:MAG: hypothetical protein E6Q97_11875 [Desulfurellales bacterium]
MSGQISRQASEPLDIAAELDAEAGARSSGNYSGVRSADKHRNTYGAFKGTNKKKPVSGDVGGLSRYFPIVYAPKARFGERDLPGGGQTEHPTAKSVTLVTWLAHLLDVRPGDLVGDPFMGSGVVGQVVAGMGADFWGCDLDPRWVEEANRRFP